MLRLAPVAADDFERVRVFIERVIEESVDATAEEKIRFIENTRSNLEKVRLAPESSVHLMYVDGPHLLGVILVRDCWNLCHLFVAPERQGSGIGRGLVEAAARQCQGRSPRGALVLNSSRNAVGLYRHLGFEPPAEGVPESYRAIRLERPL